MIIISDINDFIYKLVKTNQTIIHAKNTILKKPHLKLKRQNKRYIGKASINKQEEIFLSYKFFKKFKLTIHIKKYHIETISQNVQEAERRIFCEKTLFNRKKIVTKRKRRQQKEKMRRIHSGEDPRKLVGYVRFFPFIFEDKSVDVRVRPEPGTTMRPVSMDLNSPQQENQRRSLSASASVESRRVSTDHQHVPTNLKHVLREFRKTGSRPDQRRRVRYVEERSVRNASFSSTIRLILLVNFMSLPLDSMDSPVYDKTDVSLVECEGCRRSIYLI